MYRWTFAFLLGALLAIVPTALGSLTCVASDVNTALRLDGLSITDGILFVSVYWPLGPPAVPAAKIEALDRDGTVVAVKTVDPAPGTVVSYPLTQNATFFESHGYWFTFQIVSPAGAVLAPAISGLVSFCPAAQSCVYRIFEGVESDALGMSSELFTLLDNLESGGSSDLLHDALVQRPDLAHEIYWVADQMARLQPPGKGSKCICQWSTDFDLEPSVRVEELSHGEFPGNDLKPDWMTYSRAGAGANLLLVSQILGGAKRVLSGQNYGLAGLHLRCRVASAWTITQWAGLTLSVPTLEPCSNACPDARVSVSAFAASRAAANALATFDHGARAAASVSTSFFLGGGSQPMFTAKAVAELDRFPGDFDQAPLEQDSGHHVGEWSAWGRDANVSLLVEARVETCLAAFGPAEECLEDFVRPADDNGSWGYACSKTTTGVTLVGNASCALDASQEIKLRSQLMSTEDGALVLPWRP